MSGTNLRRLLTDGTTQPHHEKAARRAANNDKRSQRIAQILIDVVQELFDRPASRSALQLIRGIALRAQTLRMAPAAFDCANGRDALAALATSTSRSQLLTAANSNAFMLNTRWSRVVFIAGLEVSGLSAIERNRAADLPSFAPSTYPPKIFRKFEP